MRIHKEGHVIILTIIAVVVVFGGLTYFSFNSDFGSSLITIAGVSMVGYVLYFFRDPVRKIILLDKNVVYAPADGEIVALEEVYESEYLKVICIKVSIFMSIWDVHVNRYPVSGRIRYMKYHQGKYLVAFHPKSSEMNEHQTVVIETAEGVVLMVKQIAGAVARRVVCYAKEMETVIQGEELGFIKFGSRVDLYLPLKVDVQVKMHDKVKGNRTIVARFN